MEMSFTSYTKKVGDTTFYFVKRFIVFPEFENVPPLLDGFGMHTDFDTACSIASVDDTEIRRRLLNEIDFVSARQAKVIDLNEASQGNQKAVNNW